jgi:hypothetical protein
VNGLSQEGTIKVSSERFVEGFVAGEPVISQVFYVPSSVTLLIDAKIVARSRYQPVGGLVGNSVTA